MEGAGPMPLRHLWLTSDEEVAIRAFRHWGVVQRWNLYSIHATADERRQAAMDLAVVNDLLTRLGAAPVPFLKETEDGVVLPPVGEDPVRHEG